MTQPTDAGASGPSVAGDRTARFAMPEHLGGIVLPASLASDLRASSAPIVVTGPGGWLGQATLALLDRSLEPSVFQARVHAFGSNDRAQVLPSGRTFEVRRLARLVEADVGPAHIFHFAFLTKDRLQSVDQAAFVETNTAIGDLVAGAISRNGLASLFMPSSGAVYRRGTRILDDDVGANPYGALKLADEGRFGELAARLAAPMCMPRVFNLAGPFINKVDTYALATMIVDVLAGRPIEIRAAHPVLRSYTHVGDLLQLAVAMLFEPRAGDPAVFDTAGDCVVELGELADRVAHALGRLPRIVRPVLDTGREPDSYVGDRTRMLLLAERYGLAFRGLDEQIRDTANYLAGLPSPFALGGRAR